MATLGPQNGVTLTAEGAVSISYNDLFARPLDLTASIEKAFGSHPESLGIIIVRDLPASYAASRERLLRLAYRYANLDPEVRERYVDPKSRYSFGWSYGKEIMNGKPDTMKGSYYANPVVDTPDVSQELREAHLEYYGENIWPRGVAEVADFEPAFKDLGGFVFRVGCQLATACQPFASSYLSDSSFSLSSLIASSRTLKGRLLHYFPPSAENPLPTEDEPIDSWCGFHLDHSLLTGLCSALYLRRPASGAGGEPVAVPAPSPSSGLYIRTRGGSLTKVAIPADCLAFQTGEALELATDGALRATPHCVRVGAAGSGSGSEDVSRETFALFMQPDTEQRLSARETFGQFSKRIFEEHYGKEGEGAASGI